MKIQKQYTGIWFYFLAILFAVFEGYFLLYSLYADKNKTRNILILLPVIILFIAMFLRWRIKTIGILIIMFWLPLGFDNWVLYLFEITLYVFVMLLIIELLQSKISLDFLLLKNIPWLPFLLLIFGALLSWTFSNQIGGEVNEIRAMCFVPLALFIVFSFSIRSTDDAEYLLWMLLVSTAILGLVFLIGKDIFNLITLSSYGMGSDRLSMVLEIPYMGKLEMLPQSTANWFGYIFVFAYSIWIFHPSSVKRSFALALCLLYGYIIIATQGRGGALQAAIGAAIVTIYSLFFQKIIKVTGSGFKFLIVCLVVIGGFWYMATQSTNPYFYQHGVSLFVDPLSDTNLIYRVKGWLNGINLFLENPIIGIGLSGIQTPWGPDTSEILNYFLLNLLAYGSIGFIGLMLILLKLIKSYIKGLNQINRTVMMMNIACLGGLLGFFLGLQPEEPYSNVIVWAPLIIAYTTSKLHNNYSVNST